MLESPGMLLRASGGLGLAPDEPKSKLLVRGLYRDDIGVLVEELVDFICVIVKIMVPCWVLCFNTAPSIQGTQKGTIILITTHIPKSFEHSSDRDAAMQAEPLSNRPLISRSHHRRMLRRS